MTDVHNHSAANKAHYNAIAHEFDGVRFAKERGERFVPLRIMDS
jgi:hypothetical protein